MWGTDSGDLGSPDAILKPSALGTVGGHAYIGSFSQSVETTRDVRRSDEDIKADAHDVEPCAVLVGILGRQELCTACLPSGLPTV